jgi:membrane protein
MLGVSLSLTSFVTSMSDVRVEHWGGGVRHVFALLAPVIAAAAYSAVYALVPNRRVAWRHALTGGVVTALTGELMSRGFAAYVLHGSLMSIYGAFAVVPIFLMWIFLSWLTFLFGAAIAATLPQLRRTRFADTRRAGNRAVTALALVKLLFDARAKGPLGALSLESMARTVRTDEEDLAEMLSQLEDLGYARKLVPAANGSFSGPADLASGEWVLSCDPQTTSLASAFHCFALDPGNSLLQRKDLGLSTWMAPVLGGEWLERGLARAADGAPAP